MSWTTQAIKNPAAIAVMVTIALLLGILTIFRLPVQLFPNIERPWIGVEATWRAASPREMESEIVEPIEDVLRGMPGMTLMQTWSNNGQAWINMRFSLNTDMDKAYAEVSSRLQRIRNLPADADRPRIFNGAGGGAGETLIYLFVQKLPGSTTDIEALGDLIDQIIVPEIEAIDGVSGVNVNRNTGEQILRVIFDPYRAAQLGINIDAMAQRIGNSSDVSGGTVEVGRRNYTLRFEGKFSPDQLNDMILDWRGNTPIRLRDIAGVSVGPGRGGGVVYQNGNPAIGMQVQRESGANVLAAIDALTTVIDRMNDTTLAAQGLAIEKSFDPSVFIKRAITLLTNNLFIGIVLAVGILWLFLRQTRATLLIATTIPVCLLSTFVMLGIFDRSLNVISLAGLAFATGMVLDAAIVVLENIVRLREKGHSPAEAAELGAKQVWGALLASTITTVAIFVPIIFLKDVEGQLFADLALTIAIAVSMSLIVAVTVLPTGARKWLAHMQAGHDDGHHMDKIANGLMALTRTQTRRLLLITALIGGPLTATYFLWPQVNYLPPVKRDAVDAFVSFPSGANIDTIRREFAEVVVDRLQPYMDGTAEPALRNYYIITGPWGGSVGIRAKDQNRVEELQDIVRKDILSGFPDTMAFAQQGNLFGGFGGGGSIDLYLQSADFDRLSGAALEASRLIGEVLPGAQARPNPDPQVVNPEIRIIPNDRRIAEVGLTRDAIARTIRSMGDGLWLGEYFDGNSRMDIIMRAADWSAPEYLENVPLSTPAGGVIQLGDLVTIERSVGPNQIQRVDGRRTITLGINPPAGMALGTALATLKAQLEPKLRAILPADATIAYGGDASSLTRAIETLGSNFAVAVVLLFLIMAALFRSLKDAAVVIISLPMATVGGVLALQLLNLFSFAPLDLLGMIGFIILLGLVVNNAILLVAQTRSSEAEGMTRSDAVRTALSLRLRPIFMSTLTSIMGMLPLVLIPGVGSLIYRGMATVIVGGMCVSTLFTLILMPALLQLSFGRKQQLTGPVLTPAE